MSNGYIFVDNKRFTQAAKLANKTLTEEGRLEKEPKLRQLIQNALIVGSLNSDAEVQVSIDSPIIPFIQRANKPE